MGEKPAGIQKRLDFLIYKQMGASECLQGWDCGDQHCFRNVSVVIPASPGTLMCRAVCCSMGAGPNSQSFKLELGRRSKCCRGPTQPWHSSVPSRKYGVLGLECKNQV